MFLQRLKYLGLNLALLGTMLKLTLPKDFAGRLKGKLVPDFKLIKEHRNGVTYLMNVARKAHYPDLSPTIVTIKKNSSVPGISYRVHKMNFASQIALPIPFFLMTSVHFCAEDL